MIEVNMIKLVCTRCKKEFERKPYRVKKTKSNNVFCSHSCQVRYGTEQKSKNSWALCACTNCGGTFEVRTRSLARRNRKYGIFCSKKCYYMFITGNEFSTYVELTCSVCGNNFTRLKRVETSTRKRFNKICCSRACAAKAQKSDPEYIKHRLFYQLSQVIRHRTSIEVGEDVDENYLYELWVRQEGKCPYTGMPLELKKTRNRGERIPYQASIDRIDSSLGYVRGNIEFVSLIANMAKNVWSKSTLIEFCTLVVDNAKR